MARVSKANARCWSCFTKRPHAERRRPTTPVVYRCSICKQPRDRHNRSGLCLACYTEATSITRQLCQQCGERPRASKRNYCAECWRERTTAREAMSDATMIARNRKGTTGYGIPRRPCHGQCGKKVMWAPSSVNPPPPSICYGCATGRPYTITPIWQRVQLAA